MLPIKPKIYLHCASRGPKKNMSSLLVFGCLSENLPKWSWKVAMKMEDSIFSKLGKKFNVLIRCEIFWFIKNLQPHHAILIIFGAAAVTNQFLLRKLSTDPTEGIPKGWCGICQAFGVVFFCCFGSTPWGLLVLETPSGSGINQFDVATSGVALLVFNWLVNFWILVHLNDLNVKGGSKLLCSYGVVAFLWKMDIWCMDSTWLELPRKSLGIWVNVWTWTKEHLPMPSNANVLCLENPSTKIAIRPAKQCRTWHSMFEILEGCLSIHALVVFIAQSRGTKPFYRDKQVKSLLIEHGITSKDAFWSHPRHLSS